MVSIPSFILRRLYVKGSLRNTDTGMEFQILNKLGSGQARRLLPLTVDGDDLPLEDCAFHLEGEIVSFQEVSKEKPFAMALNKATVITAHGVTLSEGSHTIGMAFEVGGLGVLKFDFVDKV
jgi:hydroxymethylglutaryl-CoA reductase (NADPH)